MSSLTGPPRPPGISLWRRFAIRIVTVMVLGVLVGAGWLLFRPRPRLELTSYGAPVANAGQLLRSTEATLRDAVRRRHGVLAAASRCYYEADGTAPANVDAPQAIGDRLFCGPVLFVDGNSARPFLTFNLIATPGADGRTDLAVGSQDGDGTSPDPRPADRLVRPDGAQPPAVDRLRPPRPPAAVGDVLTTTSTLRSPLTAAAPSALMVGQLSGVRLVEYGFVDSYGWGESARTAPSGYRLLAFATDAVAGEDGDRSPDLSVRVDGNERGPLSATSDYVVVAVPKGVRQADLVLTDSGIKQSISLLTGRPNGTNLAVTVREHDQQNLAVSRPVRVRLDTGTGSGTVTGTLSVSRLSLSFWAANGVGCRQPDQAWLHIGAMLRLQGDPHSYGAEAALLSVTVPELGRLASRNAAPDPATGVDDVVSVPASLTRGSLTFAGSVRTAKGTLTVLTPVTVPFAIPAG